MDSIPNLEEALTCESCGITIKRKKWRRRVCTRTCYNTVLAREELQRQLESYNPSIPEIIKIVAHNSDPKTAAASVKQDKSYTTVSG